MDAFSYLTVLVSIILGLGITQLLTGAGRLIQARDRVRSYWPAALWAGLLLLIHVQTWWAMFGLRAVREWSFVAFLVVLMQPIVLYLLSALVLPEVGAGEHIDLRANYYAHRRWFFGLTIFLLVVSLVKDLVIAGSLPAPFNLGVHLVLMAISGGSAITRNETYHKTALLAAIVLIAVYIAVLFSRLR